MAEIDPLLQDATAVRSPVDVVTHEDERVRTAGWMASVNAARAFEQPWALKEPELRKSAAGLGESRSGRPRAAPALANALKGADKPTRLQIVATLAALKPPRRYAR